MTKSLDILRITNHQCPYKIKEERSETFIEYSQLTKHQHTLEVKFE